MYGGGVEPGKADPLTVVRTPSIRGHLRFWWRGTRGWRCSTLQELYSREREIWGSSDNPSPVTLEVEQPSTEEPIAPKERGILAYALFPALQSDEPVKLLPEGFSFNLSVR